MIRMTFLQILSVLAEIHQALWPLCNTLGLKYNSQGPSSPGLLRLSKRPVSGWILTLQGDGI